MPEFFSRAQDSAALPDQFAARHHLGHDEPGPETPGKRTKGRSVTPDIGATLRDWRISTFPIRSEGEKSRRGQMHIFQAHENLALIFRHCSSACQAFSTRGTNSSHGWPWQDLRGTSRRILENAGPTYRRCKAKNSSRCGVVIVAAGRGERAGQSAEGPKQYRTIGDRPVIAHTLDIFATWPGTGPVVVVIHPDDEEPVRGGPPAHGGNFGADSGPRRSDTPAFGARRSGSGRPRQAWNT